MTRLALLRTPLRGLLRQSEVPDQVRDGGASC